MKAEPTPVVEIKPSPILETKPVEKQPSPVLKAERPKPAGLTALNTSPEPAPELGLVM